MNENTTPLLLGDAPEKAAVVCVFTHGRNQSPEAMVEHVLNRLSARSIAYVLPRASAGSWYDAKAVDPLNDRTRTQLGASLDYLKGIADRLPVGKPVVMAGFSQGACLTLEYAMQFGPWRGALVALTGCRVGVLGDARPASDFAGMPIYLSGSDGDPWIPLEATTQAALELGAAHARLRADVFPGRSHEVSDSEILVLDGVLSQLAAGKDVQW